MPTELCYLTATEALDRFKARSLSPVELLKTLIERAEQVEPQINAFTYEYYDEALDAAKDAEQRYARGNPRPLEGIPVAVKDEFLIEGNAIGIGDADFTTRRFDNPVEVIGETRVLSTIQSGGHVFTVF